MWIETCCSRSQQNGSSEGKSKADLLIGGVRSAGYLEAREESVDVEGGQRKRAHDVKSNVNRLTNVDGDLVAIRTQHLVDQRQDQ